MLAASEQQNKTLRIKIYCSGVLQSLVSVIVDYFRHQDREFWRQWRRLHLFSQFKNWINVLKVLLCLEFHMLCIKMKSKHFEYFSVYDC